jgi:hypothetical protein
MIRIRRSPTTPPLVQPGFGGVHPGIEGLASEVAPPEIL